MIAYTLLLILWLIAATVTCVKYHGFGGYIHDGCSDQVVKLCVEYASLPVGAALQPPSLIEQEMIGFTINCARFINFILEELHMHLAMRFYAGALTVVRMLLAFC